jgi:hypothetical protein
MRQNVFRNQLFENKRTFKIEKGGRSIAFFYALKSFYRLLRIFVVENPSTKGIDTTSPPQE